MVDLLAIRSLYILTWMSRWLYLLYPLALIRKHKSELARDDATLIHRTKSIPEKVSFINAVA